MIFNGKSLAVSEKGITFANVKVKQSNSYVQQETSQE